jgi:phosphoribosylformylglycinamidine synthase subunit PurL
VLEKAVKAGVPAQRLGRTAGDALILPPERPILIANLVSRFEGWLPRYMAGNAV